MLFRSWMAQDPEFKAKVENATEEAIEIMEEEIRRRGFQGNPVEYFTKAGTKVNRIEFSDNLAMFTLKGLKPEKYRDNYPVNLTVPIQINAYLGAPPDGGAITVNLGQQPAGDQQDPVCDQINKVRFT